jgi:hypothetical protein
MKWDRLLRAAYTNISVFNGLAHLHLHRSAQPAPHDDVTGWSFKYMAIVYLHCLLRGAHWRWLLYT